MKGKQVAGHKAKKGKNAAVKKAASDPDVYNTAARKKAAGNNAAGKNVDISNVSGEWSCYVIISIYNSILSWLFLLIWMMRFCVLLELIICLISLFECVIWTESSQLSNIYILSECNV